MGNLCMGGEGAGAGAYPSRSTSGAGSEGNRLGGGDTYLSPREAAAAAAERRAANNAPAEGRMKEELLGKLREAYARKGQAAPIGLASLSVEKLQALWADMRNK